MNNNLSKTWSQYEKGKEYKRRIGLYETVHRNERYYRGDQWQNTSEQLPKPVFNVIRRIIDYLVCTVASGKVNISYSDENLPFAKSESEALLIKQGTDAMSKNASYRWERCKMDHLTYRLLNDAAISGDGIIYCYWDSNAESGQLYSGDIVSELVDSTNIFPSDVNKQDIQSQDYIILSGRASVQSLKAQAKAHGVSPELISKIQPDKEFSVSAGDMGEYELSGDDEAKATYLIKFWREDGFVCFEKSVKECVLQRVKTPCRLYPIAAFNWYQTKNSFHGTSPVSGIISNQNFINRAYAMVMKHMTDCAFSKVIYDKTKIPEWTNRIGEAIAAVGGGNISDAVSVVGSGKMESNYIELIDSAMAVTKELCGATDSALGNVIPTNTSAIIALQESSRLPLEQVRAAYSRAIEDLANIWADMMCAYYPSERLLPYKENDSICVAEADFSLLSKALLRATVEVGNISNYSGYGTLSVLDKLLDSGHISVIEYLESLPEGTFEGRLALIEKLKAKAGEKSADNAKAMEDMEVKKE